MFKQFFTILVGTRQSASTDLIALDRGESWPRLLRPFESSNPCGKVRELLLERDKGPAMEKAMVWSCSIPDFQFFFVALCTLFHDFIWWFLDQIRPTVPFMILLSGSNLPFFFGMYSNEWFFDFSGFSWTYSNSSVGDISPVTSRHLPWYPLGNPILFAIASPEAGWKFNLIQTIPTSSAGAVRS